MPVSKHRRRSKIRTRQPDLRPDAPRQNITSIDELRKAIADPAPDFAEKAIVAGVWWFQQLLRKVGDQWQPSKASPKDKRTVAMLLCVAMDGEHGANDDLAPIIADMLRPYCATPTFVEAWEQAKQMAPGTVRMMAVGFVSSARKAAM